MVSACAPRRAFLRGAAGALVLLLCVAGAAPAAAHREAASIVIPQTRPGPSRNITTDDLARIRDIVSIAPSPQGDRYAILVRQADPSANTYRMAWFVGAVAGGPLLFIGDGGEARLQVQPSGVRNGYLAGAMAHWAPDGRSLAYTSQRESEVQIWIAAANGSGARQITHNPADVRDFEWSADSRRILFTTGSARAVLRQPDERGARDGFLLEDFMFQRNIVLGRPELAPERDLVNWIVDVRSRRERPAGAEDLEAFALGTRVVAHDSRDPLRNAREAVTGAAAPPVQNADGAIAWIGRVNADDEGQLPRLRLMMSRTPDRSDPASCAQPECEGVVLPRLWWTPDGSRVIFWRKEGVSFSEDGFYAWTPETGEVMRLYYNPGEKFDGCALAAARVICIRETLSRPDHVASIDLDTGEITILADVNPEFRNIRLGAVERFEWNAAPDVHDFGYPSRLFGHIIYPPDFDPTRRYPVYIAPYTTGGFPRGDLGDEHPLYVYAANGFVVINTQFPAPFGSLTRRSPGVEEYYSAADGFPHMTMLMDSTFRALDAVIARGFVDETRVGIGGVSHGAFIPLYMLQHYDRLSAVSIGGVGWTQLQYYGSTRTGRRLTPVMSGWPEPLEFWRQIDISYHTEAIEAPLLVHYADREFLADWRLPRSMENTGRAYEGFIFMDEHHLKWQPAHRLAIYNRNLDWFRFWLQDIEDPDPAKVAQYERWRQLRELQCRNSRSLRNYCHVQSTFASPAR